MEKFEDNDNFCGTISGEGGYWYLLIVPNLRDSDVDSGSGDGEGYDSGRGFGYGSGGGCDVGNGCGNTSAYHMGGYEQSELGTGGF
jgi:hypothetical protein